MITIFGITVHGYGLLIALGVLCAGSLSSWVARRRGLRADIVWDGLWWVLLPAVAGARMYHVIDLWGEVYANNPVSVLYLWEGGLGIIGGLVGGVLGLLGYQRRLRVSTHPVSFKQLLNVAFFGLPVGQAIGRFGNWINQEVYGFPSSLPWAIPIDPNRRLPEYQDYSTFHPLFAYEAAWLLVGFAVMMFVEVRRGKHLRPVYNSTVGFYLIWYGIGRFLLDFLRPSAFILDVSVGTVVLNLAQIFSLLMVVMGVILMSDKRVKKLKS